MTDEITIRRVNVEFLRAGPPHNQLLSPYTQYLAVCNDAGAAVVTVPYEQRVFERRLKELRYETGDQSDRLDLLHEIGRDIGRMLDAVPGFTGALMNESTRAGTLVHVRVTLSAAELALLPFELAEVPVGSTASALAVQTRPPVSLTRHIRTVTGEGHVWPDRPRILFVSGDPDQVPFGEHREALVGVIRRFQFPGRDDAQQSADQRREQFGDLLTILIDPTLIELQRECESHTYTHLHILTHGDRDAKSGESFGLILRGEHGELEVVSGDRFVSAVTRVGHRPAIVTIASCDSGNVGSVVVPGASFAHALHQAGIPFVLGAQFPLSKAGSVPLAARVYEGLLWAEHPLLVLQRARAELHARYTATWHDWASVVAYEALPSTLDQQLVRLRYAQARRAVDAALERIEREVILASGTTPESLGQLNALVTFALDRLPTEDEFAIECRGLRASALKRLARAAFALAGRDRSVPLQPFGDQYDLLSRARSEYARAAYEGRAILGFLARSYGLRVEDQRSPDHAATGHWTLVQLVSLSAVLGQRIERYEWSAARRAAQHASSDSDPEERAWAHGTLAELWLLRLADPAATEEQKRLFAARARHHAGELRRLYPGVEAPPIGSTRRQFERYVDWWGTDRFERDLASHGIARSVSWRGSGSISDTARELAAMLERSRAIPTPPTVEQAGTPSSPREEGQTARAAQAEDGQRGGEQRDASPRASGTDRIVPSAASGRTFFSVEALAAGHGDSLWIEYGDSRVTHRILIDCGTQGTATTLLNRVESLPAAERFLELFVMTHIDSDHIGGALPFLSAVTRGLRFGDVWFNGWRHVSGQLGARQGEMFSTAIEDFELPWNAWRDSHAILVDDGRLPELTLPGGMRLTLLSPTAAALEKLRPVWVRELKRYGLEPGGRVEYNRLLRGTPSTTANADALTDIDGLADAPFGGDAGAPNGTSIVVLAEFGGASALLAADAHAPILVKSITQLLRQRNAARLKLDLFKVSHHGSQNNVSTELLQLLECPRYLISTNGDHHFHPDRQAMARIFKYGGSHKTLYFNYKSRFNEVWGDAALAHVRSRYNSSTAYPPADRPGIVVSLI